MIKFSTSLLAVFLLILLGGESFGVSHPGPNQQIEEETSETIEEGDNTDEGSDIEEQTEDDNTPTPNPHPPKNPTPIETLDSSTIPESRPDNPDQESVAEVVEGVETREEATQKIEESDLPLTVKQKAMKELNSENEDKSGSWSWLPQLFDSDTATDEARIIVKNDIGDNVVSDSMDENNQNLNGYVQSYIPDEVSNCDDAFSSECGSSLSNFNCGGDTNCENEIQLAQIARDEAAGEYRIPKSGMMRAAEFLQVSPGAFAAADTIQDLLGFEFSLVEEGSGVDQILSYGTPEQVCYAKVDSFIDVSGAEVEGQEVEVADEVSGMTSRIKACDNKDFDICADLRAERSDMYFNNSFTLVVHFYVYNAKDYEQEVVLNAEFFDEEGNEDTFNVFNKSNREITNGSIVLESGQRESLSLQIPNLQVFEGEDIEELYGNVLLSVFKKSSEETSLLIEENLDFAIDYPIMKMSGGESVSKEEKEKQVENSGAEATDGTTTPTSNLIDRVSLS